MTEIFERLNELNIKTQGITENILTCSDKLKVFKKKIVLWKTRRTGSLEMIPRSNQNRTIDKVFGLGLAQEHFNFVTSEI